jgi:hypothetical protein
MPQRYDIKVCLKKPSDLSLRNVRLIVRSDLSTEYNKLLEERKKANQVLRDLTPLEGGIDDAESLEGWVRMMNGKVEMITEEMKRLQSKITCELKCLRSWSITTHHP